MPFSWAKQIEDALQIKIRRAKQKAKRHSKGDMGQLDIEWKMQHQDWVTEAKTGKYDSLIKKITQDEKNRVSLALGRRAKLVGKT